MPTFTYEALNEAGKSQKGEVHAASSDDAIARIRAQGLFPTAVREQKVKKGKTGPAATAAPGQKKDWKKLEINIGGVSGKALTAFTRQLSTLQDAGLPILRSLQILEQQQKPSMFKNILKAVHEDVASGATLSDAMARHPKAFNKLYCKMIAAGEVGGVLDLILQRLAEFMEKAARLKRKIVGAMIYPSVVLLVAFVIVAFIMVFIVPSFKGIFDEFGSRLPALTLMLMDISAWMGGPLLGKGGRSDMWMPGLVYLTAVPILLWLGLKLARKSDGGKAMLDAAVLYLPVVGKLIAKTTVARFTRTLGTLITAGVPILDAITITRDTTGNYVFQKALSKVHDSVRQGESFAEPIRLSGVADTIVVNMIDVGEETGDLDKMLLKIADNYDDEVDTMVASMVSLLEPLLVVMLGGIVGFIVVALFYPMVSLIGDLSGGGNKRGV